MTTRRKHVETIELGKKVATLLSSESEIAPTESSVQASVNNTQASGSNLSEFKVWEKKNKLTDEKSSLDSVFGVEFNFNNTDTVRQTNVAKNASEARLMRMLKKSVDAKN